MAGTHQTGGILVLGSSGKLGRMLRALWRDGAGPGGSIHWQYRDNPGPGGVVWRPGEAPPAGLPPIRTVLALWGVTPGPGRDLAENRRLALAAMELATALGATRVLHCSSAAVYPPGPAPLSEDAAGGGINPYGAAKLDMEAALGAWAAEHPGGARACALRIANVAGADSLFGAIAGGAGEVTLDRFADGEGPWRSYIPMPALARVLAALLTCPDAALPDAVNVALPRPLAMEALARAAGCRVAWRPAPEGAARMVALDTARLARLVALRDESAEQIVAGWRALEAVA
ncbi:MAG: NAD-dependent epimerase/dehydratase family protein [Paracoccaceae bacterium]